MSTFFEKNWFKLALGAILIAMIASFAYKLWVNGSEPDKRLLAMKAAPAIQLQDLDGKSVTSKDLDGKVRLVYFFYSFCPDVCMPTTYLLTQVQDALKKKDLFGTKAEIVSISVDPTRDTPEVLRTLPINLNPNRMLRAGCSSVARKRKFTSWQKISVLWSLRRRTVISPTPTLFCWSTLKG
ncbi:SCO family protein [Paenibacillus sp. N3.4]|uniref:SCO family protein n=1 Tax=Paenibacillus sp. N3.4 TaxID=2603222 RepID=UPI0021C43990|nr:SCO family protein [Paenibacillus sp. N3.4]